MCCTCATTPKARRSGASLDGEPCIWEVAWAKAARFVDSLLLLARSTDLLPGLALKGVLRGGPGTAAPSGARNRTAGSRATAVIKQEALATPGDRRIPFVVITDT